MRHCPSRSFLLPLLSLGLAFVSDARAQIRVLERAQHRAVTGYPATPWNSAHYDRSRGVAVFHGMASNHETWEWSGPGAIARSRNTWSLTAICGFPGRPGQSLGFLAMGATSAVRALGQWTPLPNTGPTFSPNSIDAQAHLALDEARGRAVLVYSQRVSVWQQPTRATWEFDGQTWTLLPTNTTPTNSVMLYNPTRQCVQLVGGGGSVFEWDGATWTTWTNGPRPTHVLESAAFDRDRNRLVLGGWDNVSLAKYIHEFDGLQWTQAWVENAFPQLRVFGAMVYDEVRRTTLVSGISNPGAIAALWTWNGAQLTGITPSIVRPSPRNDAMLAEDSTRGAILFGGRDGNNVPTDETWLWDGDTWSNLNLPVAPSPRSAAAMTRAGNANVFLFGGMDANGTPLADTWYLVPGYSWTPVATAPIPARLNHAMACDLGAAGRLYMFGGTDGQNWFADLRRFESSTFPANWVVVPAANGPSARDLHAMATDEVRRKLVLFGGRNATQSILGDTWEFDLNSQTWSQRLPFHVPPLRGNHAMVYDRTRQRTLLFGGSGPSGNFYSDVWEWDGTDWTQRTLDTGSIAATENPAACFDGRTQRTVVFGGQSAGASDATYEIVEPNGPVALRQQAPLAMTVTSLPVVFGGQSTPLGVRIPSSGGLSALFLGIGQAPTPYTIGLPPLFCSQQNLHVQGLVSYLGIGNVANYTVPIPTIAVGLLLSFQGVALTASGCVDATDARFGLVGSAN